MPKTTGLTRPAGVGVAGLLVGLSIVWAGVVLNSESVFASGLIVMGASLLPALVIRAGRRLSTFLVRMGAV